MHHGCWPGGLPLEPVVAELADPILIACANAHRKIALNFTVYHHTASIHDPFGLAGYPESSVYSVQSLMPTMCVVVVEPLEMNSDATR